MNEVWPVAHPAEAGGAGHGGTNILEVYINYLRKKLGQGRQQAELAGHSVVRTVRGEGYRLSIAGIGPKLSGPPQGHTVHG